MQLIERRGELTIIVNAFRLKYSDDTLVLIILSTPNMFELGFIPFIRETDCVGVRDPLDECMARYFEKVKSEFSGSQVDTIHDFELDPRSRRPKVLVQTAAHVAGAAYFYQRKDVENQPWDPGRKIFGVSIRPLYGGWFAMRGVVIFRDVQVPNMVRRDPLDVVQGDERRIELLEKFNFHWQDSTFRDIVPTKCRYSEEQQKYFATPPAECTRMLAFFRGNSIA